MWRFWSQLQRRRPAPARTSATRRTGTTCWSRASSPWTATKDLLSRLQTLKNLPWYAEWEKGNEPPTLALAWGRWFGADNKGLAHLDEYERERAHMKALHGWMVTKGCRPAFDVDRELAPIDAEIARFKL